MALAFPDFLSLSMSTVLLLHFVRVCKCLWSTNKPIRRDTLFKPQDFLPTPDDPCTGISVMMKNFNKTIPDIRYDCTVWPPVGCYQQYSSA